MKILATILIAITLSGCIAIPYPHRVTDLPKTQGTVVDSQTGKPVSNAVITLSNFHNKQYFRGNEIWSVNNDPEIQRATKTDLSGKFIFEEVKHWQYFKFLWLGPLDIHLPCSELSLTYQFNPSDKPILFDDPKTQSFAFRQIYSPHIIIGDNSTPRYGPITFETLKITSPNNEGMVE